MSVNVACRDSPGFRVSFWIPRRSFSARGPTGDEVVQLYVHEVSPVGPRALKDLRGIQKLTLKPGESRLATFTLIPNRDFTHYDVEHKRYAVDAGTYEVQIGASSSDIRVKSNVAVEDR